MKEKLVVAVCLTLCAVLFASVTVGGLRLGAEADEESAPGDLVQIEIGEGSVLLPTLDDGASDELEIPWTYQEIEMLAKTIWAEAGRSKSTAQPSGRRLVRPQSGGRRWIWRDYRGSCKRPLPVRL